MNDSINRETARLIDEFRMRLQFHRKKYRYTQQMLADLIGISGHYLHQIESGKVFPTLDTAIKLCLALKMPLPKLPSDSEVPFAANQIAPGAFSCILTTDLPS